ncbi:aryl-sulfate sulfotransferase [Lactobacillus crispatus]|nr:aryl-sulfate sulfotransferase [Lactobacillus crispatus]
MEDPFWAALREIAEARGQSVQALIGAIDAGRDGQNLSSAIRVFVLEAVRAMPET